MNQIFIRMLRGRRQTIVCFMSANIWFHIWASWVTYCLPPSGRWLPYSPSCPRGWPEPAVRGWNGRAAGPSVWSETCCDPQTDTPWLWRCSLRCPLLAWSSGSTGTKSRCGSGWGCSPAAPTEGTAGAAGSPLPSNPAGRAWALKGKQRSSICLINQLIDLIPKHK